MNKWYEDYWREKEEQENPAFATFFEDEYGKPEDFHLVDSEDEDDYWHRRGFVLMGWIAGREHEKVQRTFR